MWPTLLVIFWNLCRWSNPWSLPRFLGDWGYLFKPILWSVEPTYSTLTSAAWHIVETLPLNIQPSTRSRVPKGVVLQYQPLPKHLEVFHILPISISFGVSWTSVSLYPQLQSPEGQPWVSLGAFCKKLWVGPFSLSVFLTSRHAWTGQRLLLTV